MEESNKINISRRGFLKTAALTGRSEEGRGGEGGRCRGGRAR